MSVFETALAIHNATQSYIIYSAFIIVTLGIIGNVLNILIFGKLKLFRGHPCAFYLYFESIMNVGGLVFTLISCIFTMVGNGAIAYSTTWCKLKSMLFQIFSPISLSIICFAALDQFLSTNYIVYIKQLSTLKLAQRCIFISICFWILHSIPAGILANPYYRISCFPSNPTFIQYYNYFYYPILSGAFPMLISATFSLLAFRNVRRIVRRHIPIVRRRLDQQMTTLVFARVIIFIILYIPHIGLYIFSLNSIYTTNDLILFFTIELIQAIDPSLVFLNHAITFYVFYVSSARYRRQVKYFLLKRFWRQCKQLLCCVYQNQIVPITENSNKSESTIES